VPVTWGALRIEVTDDHRIPHRGSYDIIRADTREVVGTGSASTPCGRDPPDLAPAAGLYRIVKPGRDYRALRDFESVAVPAAGFVPLRLVMDEEPAISTAPASCSRRVRERGLGADQLVQVARRGREGAMTYDRNVAGANQTLLSASAFIDAPVRRTTRTRNHFSFLGQIEEGGTYYR
jgi:hypothetical protein